MMDKDEAMKLILNSPPKELVTEFKKMQQGELTSFKNNLVMMYETQRHLKDNIIEKSNKDEITPEEADEILKPMYVYMQKVEDVVTIATTILKERTTTLTLEK